MAALLFSGLSNGFVLNAPAVSPLRTNVPAMNMNEAAAKAAWLASQPQPGAWAAPSAPAYSSALAPPGMAGGVVKAPKSGWSLTMAGGSRSIEDVYAAQKKAAKSYNNALGKDHECDIKRYEKGWTTK